MKKRYLEQILVFVWFVLLCVINYMNLQDTINTGQMEPINNNIQNYEALQVYSEVRAKYFT